MSDDSVETPGWNAISAALEKIYGKQEPRHFGTMIRYSLGGPDPLDGLSVYEANGGEHWHYVTYGFSELYEKESDNKEYSGWGFELTFRLERPLGQPEPPQWPLNFLQNLARYVFSSGNVFAPGHNMTLNGPIALGEQTAITAITFIADPQLGEIKTPNGKMRFLQIVGITSDEHSFVQAWNASSFAEEFAKSDPLLVTRLKRESLLAIPAIAAEMRERAEKEGSSMGSYYGTHLKVETTKAAELIIEMGALIVENLVRILPARLRHGRELTVLSSKDSVHFAPASKTAWQKEAEHWTVNLCAADLNSILGTLKAVRGTYTWPTLPAFTIRVVPSEIKGQDGKVEKVIG